MILDLSDEPSELLRPAGTLALDAIDGLGWTVGAMLDGYGVRIGLRADCRETMSAVIERLPPAFEASDGGPIDRLYSIHSGVKRRPRARKMSLVFADEKRIARQGKLSEALDALDDDLDSVVAGTNRTYLALSAGVCGNRGKALVLVGGRRSGKTRLVKALIEEGAEYLSEGIALIDGRLRVQPYPRPLRLHGAQRLSAAALDAWVCKVSLPVGLIVLLRYRPTQGVSLVRLAAGAAGLREGLESQVLSAPDRSGLGKRLLDELVKTPAYELERGEAAPAARQLLEALAAVV